MTKDERAKYLIIGATDITRQLYEPERIAYCNDWFTRYNRIEKIDANEFFEKNNVPDEFRKIIVKISAPVFSKKESEEFTTGFPFDFQTKTISKLDNKKYIRMNNSPIYHNDCMFDDKIVFKTEEQYTSVNNVIYFLEECYKQGHLENYIQSVKEFFDMSLDLGLLLDSWRQIKNQQKALKLYRRRVASKRIY